MSDNVCGTTGVESECTAMKGGSSSNKEYLGSLEEQRASQRGNLMKLMSSDTNNKTETITRSTVTTIDGTDSSAFESAVCSVHSPSSVENKDRPMRAQNQEFTASEYKKHDVLELRVRTIGDLLKRYNDVTLKLVEYCKESHKWMNGVYESSAKFGLQLPQPPECSFIDPTTNTDEPSFTSRLDSSVYRESKEVDTRRVRDDKQFNSMLQHSGSLGGSIHHDASRNLKSLLGLDGQPQQQPAHFGPSDCHVPYYHPDDIMAPDMTDLVPPIDAANFHSFGSGADYYGYGRTKSMRSYGQRPGGGVYSYYNYYDVPTAYNTYYDYDMWFDPGHNAPPTAPRIQQKRSFKSTNNSNVTPEFHKAGTKGSKVPSTSSAANATTTNATTHRSATKNDLSNTAECVKDVTITGTGKVNKVTSNEKCSTVQGGVADMPISDEVGMQVAPEALDANGCSAPGDVNVAIKMDTTATSTTADTK